jgi:hypothetical protein
MLSYLGIVDDRLNIIVFLEICTYHETPPTFYLLCTVIENLILSDGISWIEYRNSVINCMNSVQSQLIRTGEYGCEFLLQLHTIPVSNSIVSSFVEDKFIVYLTFQVFISRSSITMIQK